MKPRFRITRGARADLIDIFDWIAQYNRPAADKLREEFRQALRRLAQYPEMGAVRDRLPGKPRALLVRRYLVLYRVAEDELTVTRVIDGRRDLKALLNDE